MLVNPAEDFCGLERPALLSMEGAACSSTPPQLFAGQPSYADPFHQPTGSIPSPYEARACWPLGPWCTRSPGVGMAMHKVSQRKFLQLKVRTTFESSRLNVECVSQAYECIVPIAKRRSADESRLTERPAKAEAAAALRSVLCGR